MRRLCIALGCALLTGCSAEEEPPALVHYQFELAAHDESMRALEAQAKLGLDQLPRLAEIEADAPSALAFELANPDFFVRSCQGRVLRECVLLAMRLLRPYVDAVRQGLAFDAEIVELTAGLIDGYVGLYLATASKDESGRAASESLREVTESFVLDAFSWVGSDGLDASDQEELVARIHTTLDRASGEGRDPMTLESCPELEFLAQRALDRAVSGRLRELAASTGCPANEPEP